MTEFSVVNGICATAMLTKPWWKSSNERVTKRGKFRPSVSSAAAFGLASTAAHRPAPKRIKAVGTEAIARLSIIRGVGTEKPTYVYNGEPNKQSVELTWTDQKPAWGQRSYYYVRVEQTRPKEGGFGALAWASPMWITAEE